MEWRLTLVVMLSMLSYLAFTVVGDAFLAPVYSDWFFANQ